MTQNNVLSCFKAYDVRGRVPEDLNPEIARAIGHAYADILQPESVVLGHDIRLTSPLLSDAVAQGLMDAGVNVFDIGLCGTEEVYFATFHSGMGGGIMVTASHNPMEYNGLKFVREGASPISADSGLKAIQEKVLSGKLSSITSRGHHTTADMRADYIMHLLSYVDRNKLKPLKIVADSGNGGAGLVMQALAPHLPFEWININFDANGHFPNGVPNPLLPERRAATIAAVKAHGADLGIAWDGDFDRCFFFDEQGNFIEGYYIIGLLAESFLTKSPGEKIVHDPRLTWNTIDIVEQHGGIPVQSKTGHAFMKESMRRSDALYGGEMSAHHFFRDFAYCDSGMIPWLLVAELVSAQDKPLSQLVGERIRAFPCSGEINFKVRDVAQAIAAIRSEYETKAISVDETDGIGLEFENYRFNLRGSNTEPVLRLNVEARGDAALMEAKTKEITNRILHHG
jgi:phosphomannomutase